VDFETLYDRICPALKKMARYYNGHGFFIDGDDLYQEMCMHLWGNYKAGMPNGINEPYVIKGCEFHIRNYIRKHRSKASFTSLQEPIGDSGDTLQDVLPDRKEPIDVLAQRDIFLDEIRNNGLSGMEKKVLMLLLEGYTCREAGKALGISHVMILKYKQRIIKKCRREAVT
jgi:RNA polymerase sigma factor (sigma-70 family)